MKLGVLLLAVTIVCLVGPAAEAALPRVPSVPDDLPMDVRQGLLEKTGALTHELTALQSAGQAFNVKCADVESGSIAESECTREHAALEKRMSRYTSDIVSLADLIRRLSQENHVTTIVRGRGIQRIQVPPPIPPEEASIGIGQLAPSDMTSRRILLGLEAGVAVAGVYGKIGSATMPYVKLILATGKTVIAAEDAADVYLVRQNDAYERALAYLKDAKKRSEFTAIVRALKERKPLSENASIDMVWTAQAILDPKLGNSGIRIAWNAMLSPEARRAAVTEATIQLGGEILGQLSGSAFKHIQATQSPAFREAKDFLEHASVAMRQVKDPAAKESLRIAIGQANHVIANTYRTVEPAAEAIGHLQSIFAKEAEEERRTKKQE